MRTNTASSQIYKREKKLCVQTPWTHKYIKREKPIYTNVACPQINKRRKPTRINVAGSQIYKMGKNYTYKHHGPTNIQNGINSHFF